jgi:hypothetical protein
MSLSIANNKENKLILLIFTILFLIIFIIEPLDQIFNGFILILTSPSILLTDYLLVGGLAATLLNVSLTVLLNLFIVKKLKLEITGPIFACLMMIAGFAFFGKNLFNAIPIYIGIYLYSKVTKIQLKDLILVFLLSSGISPSVSYILFGLNLEFYYSIPLAILVGMLIGFILPAFNAHTIKFHQGYNLYNTGFSMGIISMMMTGIMLIFFDIERQSGVNNSYHIYLLFSLIIISLVLIIASFILDPKVHIKYQLILKKTGRLITDFNKVGGFEATLLNIGIMGLLSALVVLSLNVLISGPIIGAIITIMGFAAFGKHPLNSMPVVLGAILAVLITPLELKIDNVLAILFVTGLAPLSGRYGIIAGLLAGFVHLLITPLALSFQGGFDLYNNGFAAGFVAALITSLFSIIKPSTDELPL